MSKISCALGGVVLGAVALAACGEKKTELSFTRFFGSCEAEYGKVTDVKQARGECGIITSIVNQFNATNPDHVVVKPQIVEWGPYYDQLSARIVSGDIPAVAVMHESALGDFVARNLVEPLDDGLKSLGITPADFTDQARRGTVIGGKLYALPFDTWSWLWHINLNMMKQAGLVNPDGSPILPTSPEELIAQAEKFKAATGKPYFSWPTVNEFAAPYRTFLTLVAQQGGTVFPPGGKTVDVRSDAARRALELIGRLYSEGHVKTGADYGAANQAFLTGDAGIVLVGTWTIDDFLTQSKQAGSPLANGYTVVPFPPVFGKKAVFADGHSWVLLKGGTRDDKTRKAALALLRALWDNDFEWSRTGHLPARKSVAESAPYRELPFRANIAEIASTAYSVPSDVARQRAVEVAMGEEIGSMYLTKKPLADVQTAIEQRVGKLLSGAN
ncbi:MAG TPA: extracellular solute-binding protein [Kofleriaceae bacterium]|jgi:multiple sugar transport system substrate-binding protein|nr:extracellular solute-binding protein [Kofleriaceae bacterium]